ncbi:MAG: hypothetical protein ACYS8W_02450 [Planctomycetota bacterium]|jgi:hypothetical protein
MVMDANQEKQVRAVLNRAKQIEPEVSAAIFLRRDRELAWEICQKYMSVHETQAELYLDPEVAYTSPELLERLAQEYVERRKQEG